MSEPHQTESIEAEATRPLLEAFVVDNKDLQRLESLLAQFNIFEAMGAVHQELRHSAVLAFLLDPHQNHGLGDTFAKRLLQRALGEAKHASIPLTPIDLDLWDLDDTVVQRESDNIDIPLVDEPHRVVVIVENKIASTEHSGQLQRYRESVTKQYQGWTQIRLYLTPERDAPTDQSYLPVGYRVVCEILEELVESRASSLSPEVRSFLTQYDHMLRRHIVSESEIAELCRRIYQKHRRAIDTIVEHIPDRRAAVRPWLEKLIQETPALTIDDSSLTAVRFALEAWDAFPDLRKGEGWVSSNRILVFEFANYTADLTLRLYIGPGATEVRQKLVAMAKTSGTPFASSYEAIHDRPEDQVVSEFVGDAGHFQSDPLCVC